MLERVARDIVEGPLDRWFKVVAKVSLMQVESASGFYRVHIEFIHPAIQTLDHLKVPPVSCIFYLDPNYPRT